MSPYEDAKDDQNRVNAVEFEEVPMATQDSPSLYDRLGGVYSIATVMDDFIDRIMVDPRLNANPRVDGRPIIVFPPRASSTSSRKWFAGLLVGLKSTPAVP